MKKMIFALAGVIAIGLGVHVVAGPLMAMSDMKEAIEAHDGAALADRVDFPALRADLKQDLDFALQSAGDPVAQAFASAVLGGVIEGLMTPDSLVEVLANGSGDILGPHGSPKGATGEGKDGAMRDYDMKFGLSRFILTLEGDAGPIDLIFAPEGLTWKVVGIDMDLDSVING